MKSLILFSNDLRLDDNEAICAAVAKFMKKRHSYSFMMKNFIKIHMVQLTYGGWKIV